MMKFKVKSLFAAMMMTALVAAGCNENTIDPDPGTTPLAPTNLMANSADGAVNLKWTASTTATGGYELTVTPQGGTAMPVINIPAAATSYTVSTLTNGTTYTFALKSRSTSTTTMSGATNVTWAPAKRWTGVKIYETASSNGSGVNLATGSVLNVASGANWDIGLDTRIIGGVVDDVIGAPTKLSYAFSSTSSARATLVSAKVYENVASLDALFDTEALGSTTATLAPKVDAAVQINNTTQNAVFFVKTVDGNYAKILLKATGGKVLQGTAPNRYVEMDISYQTVAEVPYAFKGNATGNPSFKTIDATTHKKGE